MNDDDVFYRISMIMNVDPAEIAKIVNDYIERNIGCGTVYDHLNCPKPPIYIKPVKLMTLRDRIIEEAAKELQNKVDKLILQKEDNEMKSTSVQNIKNVKDVCFDISSNPIEKESKLTIVASTNDDIFAFEFEGPDLLQSCKRAGLFTGWEKDQKIRELEAKSKDIANDNALLLENNKKLKEDKEYAEKLNKELIDRWQKRYGDILEENKLLKTENQHLREDIMKLKGDLHNIKTAKAEEPSSRSDILDFAKKCVCGKREQDYGTPESNFQLIADLWNQYLFKEPGAKEVFGIGPMDVAMMMGLMKIARIRNGGGSGDSFVDLAGYAACGGEIWASNKATNGDSSQETN